MRRRLRLLPKGLSRNLIFNPSPSPRKDLSHPFLPDILSPCSNATPETGNAVADINSIFDDANKEHDHNPFDTSKPKAECFLPTLTTPPRRRTLRLRRSERLGGTISSLGYLRSAPKQPFGFVGKTELGMVSYVSPMNLARQRVLAPPSPPTVRPRHLQMEFDAEATGSTIVFPDLLTPHGGSEN